MQLRVANIATIQIVEFATTNCNNCNYQLQFRRIRNNNFTWDRSQDLSHQILMLYQVSYLEWWKYVWQMLYRTKFSFNFATIGCCNQWMQYLQLRVVLLYCNQIIAGITIVWLQQLKVANIATIYCTSVALWLQIFAVYCNNLYFAHTFHKSFSPLKECFDNLKGIEKVRFIWETTYYRNIT